MSSTQLVSNILSEQQTNIDNYISHMDEHHKKAYSIAKNHLKTSFNIIKSNGYKEWLQKQNKK